MDLFDLEKKSDGIYRCKGGSLADMLLLSYVTFLSFIGGFLSLFGLRSYWIESKLFGGR